MIGIVGYMSGGKSYFAVERILQLLLANHTIVTNITLNCKAVTDYLGVPCVFWKRLYYFLTDDDNEIQQNHYHWLDLRQYEKYPCGSPRGSADYDANMVYVFFDEASSVFDSMVTASDSSIVKVATWARHTRKRGIEVVLLMQFASELNKRLRSHIVEFITCTNSSNIKIPVVGLGLPSFLRNMSIRQRFCADMKTPIGDAKWTRFNPKVYNCYNTAQIVVGSGMELVPHSKIDYSVKRNHDAIVRSVIALLAASVVLVFCGVFVWMSIN